MKKDVLHDGGDPMGAAIYDFHKNGSAGVLKVYSSEFDDDEIPVRDLFRSFDEMPELFCEEYTMAPEGGYAMALPYYYETEVDLAAGDSVRDTISYWTYEDEYGAMSLTVSLNGQEYTEESWSTFSVEPYLVCVEENFLPTYRTLKIQLVIFKMVLNVNM